SPPQTGCRVDQAGPLRKPTDLRKKRKKRSIQQLKNADGTLQHQTEKKKHIVKSFFEKLYSREDIPEENMQHYLKRKGLPMIPEKNKEEINREITLKELQEAILKQKNNKTLGPDGLPGELYKTLQEKLEMQLLELFYEVLTTAKLPKSWGKTYIRLIPKEDLDHQLIQNYRPISLLNVDYKLFMSIMIIHSDQNGFLPNRQIKNNTRMVMNIIEYYEANLGKQLAMVFLNAQKAFDNVNWQFIIQQLKSIQFGNKFIKLISTIYMTQMASVILNGDRTEMFKINKGIRQGCPLSPLLFILNLENLLENIRKNEEIKRALIKKEHYKVQAFAEDIVFFLEDPEDMGVKLIKEIEEFGKVAGLKINKNKTKLLTKNLKDKQQKELEGKLGMQRVKKLKYLGVWLTARCSSIKKDNYDKLIIQIKKN
uniref:Reverse transcriptase domain-containing protein n=1 Tax=Naja naja TaxID=35670 RepID=A0A8C6Y8P5_NAJNA